MAGKIDLDVKRQCVDMERSGMTSRQIYNEYFHKVHPNMGWDTFRAKLRSWRRKALADELTQYAGTYPGFVAHNATVQVNGKGEVVQAWIKQSEEERSWDDLLEVIKNSTEPMIINPCDAPSEMSMLIVPIYDAHFPLAEYNKQLEDILQVIRSKCYEQIVVIVGQDLFHADGFGNKTFKGTPMGDVDIPKAWSLARYFFSNIMAAAVEHGREVRVIYSEGNHSKSMEWCFVQMLREMFPTAKYDDDLKPRKCVYWNECFIGITHGDQTKCSPDDMRSQFTIEYPVEFASSKVREILTGHIHHEVTNDIYGVTIRSLSTAVPPSKWSVEEGFIGAQRRFQLFEFSPGRLKAIYYI